MSAAAVVSAKTQAGRRPGWNLTEGMARETAACGPPGSPDRATPTADTPASVTWSLTAKPRSRTMLRSFRSPSSSPARSAVELSELPGLQRREQGLAAGCAVGRQHPAGPVPHPQQLVAFHRGDKADLCSDPHHQVRRLIDLGYQYLQVGPGDLAERQGRIQGLSGGIQRGTGPVEAILALLGEVPVDEHRQQPVGR